MALPHLLIYFNVLWCLLGFTINTLSPSPHSFLCFGVQSIYTTAMRDAAVFYMDKRVKMLVAALEIKNWQNCSSTYDVLHLCKWYNLQKPKTKQLLLIVY